MFKNSVYIYLHKCANIKFELFVYLSPILVYNESEHMKSAYGLIFKPIFLQGKINTLF